MPSVDQASPPFTGTVPKLPEGLPRGLITPPAQVRERIEKERAKHPPEAYAKNEERLLNEWTISYTFNGLCLEVVYRPTRTGPEVLAVGMEEVIALKKATPLEEQKNLQTFLGY